MVVNHIYGAICKTQENVILDFLGKMSQLQIVNGDLIRLMTPMLIL